MEPGSGGERVELRSLGEDLMGDDVLGFGPRFVPEGETLRLDRDVYEQVPTTEPPPAPPAHFAGLIGEYGWDHDVLYILEKEGRLHALIEWFFLYPLTEKSPDVFEFPDTGLYHGEKLVFRRDANGKATEVEAASVAFKRRPIDGEDGRTFRITPTRPAEEIRKEIAGARPPVERDGLKPSDLVDLTAFVPGLKLDIRYATAINFLGMPLYTQARALMQRPAAEALARVQAQLAPKGYGLLIHDAYRPWKITKLFWEATPEAQHLFVAEPVEGLAAQPGLRRGPDPLRPGHRPADRDGQRLRRVLRAGLPQLPGRVEPPALASRPAPLGDGVGRVHRQRVGMVALRLQQLARLSDY